MEEHDDESGEELEGGAKAGVDGMTVATRTTDYEERPLLDYALSEELSSEVESATDVGNEENLSGEEQLLKGGAKEGVDGRSVATRTTDYEERPLIDYALTEEHSSEEEPTTDVGTEENLTEAEETVIAEENNDQIEQSQIIETLEEEQMEFTYNEEVTEETKKIHKEQLDWKYVSVLLLFLSVIILLIVFYKKCQKASSSPLGGNVSCEKDTKKPNCNPDISVRWECSKSTAKLISVMKEKKHCFLANPMECFVEVKEKLATHFKIRRK